MLGDTQQSTAKRVRIWGCVQGVGYRAFVAHEAQRIGVDGFVRNRRDGSVEAVFAGTCERVAAIIAACRVGPHSSRVDRLDVMDLEAMDESVALASGFAVRATL